MNSVVFCKTK